MNLMRKGAWRLSTAAAVLVACSFGAPAAAQSSGSHGVGTELYSDFRYAVNNLEADVEDVVTSPLHIGALFSEDGLMRQPKTYYTLLGAAAALGGAFALDETVRAHLHDMPKGVANGLQDSGGPFVAAGGALLYAYGLYSDDDAARQQVFTAGESALVAGLATEGTKLVFGRLRPRQGRGAFVFFDHGSSFVAGHPTPAFAGAAALSEYFDNRWYVAIPLYAAAMATGFGRIGNDAHWLSDVVGAGLVGIGTSELLLYMHRQHAENPSRFRIFPMNSPQASGLELAFEW